MYVPWAGATNHTFLAACPVLSSTTDPYYFVLSHSMSATPPTGSIPIDGSSDCAPLGNASKDALRLQAVPG